MKKRKVNASDDEELDEVEDNDDYHDEEDGDESDNEKKRKTQQRKGAFSDDESSESSVDDFRGKETLTEQLKKIIAERDRTIEKLETELARHRTAGTRMNNTQVREQLKWTGE